MMERNLGTIHKPGTSAAPALLVGCAGWALGSKDAASFPTQGSHLERYAQVFTSVEINSSFYRSHQSRTYARWADSVPDTFRFSVKMPRTITHESRLRRCEDILLGFLEEVSHLGAKLGCILVQLPPSLALGTNEAARFFSLLRAHTSIAVACEPRHASWLTPAGASVLHDAGVILVQADPPPIAEVFDQSSDVPTLYIRLHGAPEIYYSAYDDEFIASIAARMRRAHERNGTAWCIFDNTARGAAIPNALMLIKQLAS
jgi:uncharacterized protein YecE (DUF72 family)